MKKLITNRSIPLLILFWLLLANISYFSHNFIGWAITLSFFFFMPGLLVLKLFKMPQTFKPYLNMFAVGLSILALMVAGLVINQLTLLGDKRPLSTFNIFLGLDILTLALLALNWGELRGEQIPRFNLDKVKPSREVFLIGILSLLSPILAVLGAFRLNNGASDILTLVDIGLICGLFLWLAFRPKLERFYPFTLCAMALSILFSASLRGWHVTGHDIQNEFLVFQLTLQNQHWDISRLRSTYNACLSITILPTMIAKLTAIPAIYVYKVVFQVLFALVLMPIYHFIKMVSNKTIALAGSFIFISFPVFLNDMPFLNRQEVAFIFFALLLIITFIPKLTYRKKTTLTLLMLLGLVLSHYSSTYVALAVIIGARVIFSIINRRFAGYKDRQNKGTLVTSWSVIVIALLITFLWNTQITSTTDSLKNTITGTIKGALDHSGAQAEDVSYGLFSGSNTNPPALLDKYATDVGGSNSTVDYVGNPIIPPTRLGTFLTNHGINAPYFNSVVKQLSAKVLQVLLLIGMIVMAWKLRAEFSQKSAYLFSLCVAAIALLALQTLLPQLSVDYGTLRLFQQLLFITAIPIVMGAMTLIPFKQPVKSRVMYVFFALMALSITSFISQIFGSYSPPLSLDNAGLYYEDYYIHKGEIASANWLLANRNVNVSVNMDRYAELRFNSEIKEEALKVNELANANSSGYIYQDYANVHTGTYQTSTNGTRIRYVLTENIQDNKNLIYNDSQSDILK